jgi:two-component system LytT family response regulator
MIKAIIIDDDSNLRQGLLHLLKQLAPDIEVVGQVEEVAQGVNALHQLKPDVLFLDIQLTDGTGFDILEQFQKQFGKPNFQVIFITAHEQYALKAFRFSALDYLLKPIDLDDLQQVIEKIRKNKNQVSEYKNIEVLLEHLSQKTSSKRMALPTAEGIHLFDIKDIIRIESSDNYSIFYFKNNEKIMVSKTLKDYEDLLTPHGFERIHQSHLINMSYLKSFLKKDSYVVMIDGKQLPVAIRKKERLQQIINQL